MWGHWHSETFLFSLIARSADQLAKIVSSASKGGVGEMVVEGWLDKDSQVFFILWLQGHFVC